VLALQNQRDDIGLNKRLGIGEINYEFDTNTLNTHNMLVY